MKEEEAEGADGRSPQGTEPEEKATCRRKDEGNFGWPRSDKAQKRVFFLPPLSLFFGGCPLSEAEDGEGFGGGGGGGGGGADSAPVPGGEGGAGGASCVKCGGRGFFNFVAILLKCTNVLYHAVFNESVFCAPWFLDKYTLKLNRPSRFCLSPISIEN